MTDLGQFIKTQRENLGMNTLDLSKLLNVSNSMVSNWESGKKSINLIHLIHLANIFEISLSDLLNLKESENIKTKVKYDFVDKYFTNDKLDIKKLNTESKKRDFLIKYSNAEKEFAHIIQEYFNNDNYYNILFNSFVKEFGANYNGQKLTKELLLQLKTQIDYEQFINNLDFEFKIEDYIFSILNKKDKDIFIVFIKKVNDEEKLKHLLEVGQKQKADKYLLLILYIYITIINKKGETNKQEIENFIEYL